VRPPDAVAGAVRVALRVTVLVVDAVDRHPLQWPALVGQRAQGGEDVLHEPGGLKAPVREQAVVAHGHAQPGGQVEDQADDDARPAKGEGGEQGPHLDDAPADDAGPIVAGPAVAPAGAGTRMCGNGATPWAHGALT